MAKRLRDTEMWAKQWFRELSLSAKLFWIYILDKCSFAGIYEIDFDLAKFFTKAKIDETTLNELSKQFIKIDDKRIFIKDFIDFQYGKIHETHKMKNKIMAELSKYSIPYPIDTLSDYDNRVSSISDTVKDKEEDKDKVMVNVNSFVLKREEAQDKGEQNEPKQQEKPLWQQNSDEGYAEYLRMSEPHFDALLSDWKWIAVQKEYFPGCSVKRTLFRMWEQFWGTKAGWKNKRDAARGKPDYDPNWKQTIELNFKKSICYYGRDEVDDEKQQIDIKKRMGEL